VHLQRRIVTFNHFNLVVSSFDWYSPRMYNILEQTVTNIVTLFHFSCRFLLRRHSSACLLKKGTFSLSLYPAFIGLKNGQFTINFPLLTALPWSPTLASFLTFLVPFFYWQIASCSPRLPLEALSDRSVYITSPRTHLTHFDQA
jgi:hypothetical protein